MPHAYLNPTRPFRPAYNPDTDRRTADAQHNVDRDAGKIERATGLPQTIARQLAERIHFSN